MTDLPTLNDELSDGTFPSPDFTGRDDGRMDEMGGEGELLGRVGGSVQPVHKSVGLSKCSTDDYSPSDLDWVEGQEYLGQRVHPVFRVLDMLGSPEGEYDNVGEVDIPAGVTIDIGGRKGDLLDFIGLGLCLDQVFRESLVMGPVEVVEFVVDEAEINVEVFDGSTFGGWEAEDTICGVEEL